jgi:hypothetical protein
MIKQQRTRCRLERTKQVRYSDSSGGGHTSVHTSNLRGIHHNMMVQQVLRVKQMRSGILSFRPLMQYREGCTRQDPGEHSAGINLNAKGAETGFQKGRAVNALNKGGRSLCSSAAQGQLYVTENFTESLLSHGAYLNTLDHVLQ